MIERFQGESGQRRVVDVLRSSSLTGGNDHLCLAIAERATLAELQKGSALFEQESVGNDVYFVLAGAVSVVVNGRPIATRGTGAHVGEMAIVEPALPRSASIVADSVVVVAQLSEPHWTEIATRFPEVYRNIAKELARRLRQRNSLVSTTRDKSRVFIISSAESLEVARAIQNAFERDPFTTVIWTDGVFKIAGYAIESLESQLDDSDFAIAIAHTDDVTQSRGKTWPAARDNVIFELGLFMGRLGKERAILMEPRETDIKLPSDFAGITTVPYRFDKGPDAVSQIAPACNALRRHIIRLGPNN
jgi:CRP/FNR family transcriptional regulator, cyclic AMP receptor protein